MRYFLPLLLGVALLAPSSSFAAPGDKPVLLADCLVLPRVSGGASRSPLHTDAVEAAIVAGTWKAPRLEEKVESATGRVSTWQKARADKNGHLQHFALFGGYLHWRVARKSAGVMLLEASGHALVYVNGEPRAGDVYSHGFVRVPVLLRAGDNDLLFLGARGRIGARLTPITSPVLLDTHDLTLPDLIAGEKGPVWGAVVVINAGDKPAADLALEVVPEGGEPLKTMLPVLQPSSVRKVGFLVPAKRKPGESVALELRLRSAGTMSTAKVALSVRRPTQAHKRTFVSDIDGSVQYYAVVPAQPKVGDKSAPGLILSLHGAKVEATRQAGCYAPKPYAHVVAPTNRRSFGFDWEDWGRLDALEVLALAGKSLRTDPRRTYLTGHSMGGHGTWHLGATYPDRWAAIAPSAGWISFATYVGRPPPARPTPMQEMLLRPTSPSNTLALVRNHAMHGVYVLHGDIDDNVPVKEARTMRQLLGGFHPDFVYYERRGAGHWWGDQCVDWPPISEFFAARTRPRIEDVRHVDFVTASPGVSAWCHWAGIESQAKAMQPSEVHLRLDSARRTFAGTTVNVARLALDLVALRPGAALDVELDGQKLGKLPWPEKGARVWLKREEGKWSAMGAPAPALKGPQRYGPFKEAFRNRVMFVYGTKGTAGENAWAFAKARFDAETFWYRGNASVDVIADTAFDAKREPDRNVVLYGHAQSNAAWAALLGTSPVQVKRGVVQVGTKTEKGDLGCLVVRPRPGSDRALVAAVSGSGLAGMRLTDRLPVFSSGVGYPDCLVMGPEVLTKGLAGVRTAGFFGVDWGVASGEWVWRKAD